MIYEALVIDNADFAKKGTIRVRIKDYTVTPASTGDLSEKPSYLINEVGGQQYVVNDTEKQFTYTDTDVKVSSPIGGGYDYGLFMLPQPNTWGLVASIGNNWELSSRGNFVWIGALYKANADGDYSENTKISINIPSNTIAANNGVDSGTINLDNFSSTIVLKTKTTYISNSAEDIDESKSKETLSFKKQPTENLIIIDKDKILMTHNIVNDNNETIALATYQMSADGFNLTYNNKEKSVTSDIKLEANGDFEILKNDGDNNTAKITGDSDGIIADYLNSNDEGATLRLSKKPAEEGGTHKTEASLTAFAGGGSSCYVKVKSDGIDMETSGNISINANGKVTLGNLGLPVLCSPTGASLQIGTVTIPVSTNVIA